MMRWAVARTDIELTGLRYSDADIEFRLGNSVCQRQTLSDMSGQRGRQRATCAVGIHCHVSLVHILRPQRTTPANTQIA